MCKRCERNDSEQGQLATASRLQRQLSALVLETRLNRCRLYREARLANMHRGRPLRVADRGPALHAAQGMPSDSLCVCVLMCSPSVLSLCPRPRKHHTHTHAHTHTHTHNDTRLTNTQYSHDKARLQNTNTRIHYASLKESSRRARTADQCIHECVRRVDETESQS